MTINQLVEAAQQVRHQQLRKERVLLARALAPIPRVNLELARHVGAGSPPGIVSDPRRWLVPVPPIELTAAVDALLAVVRAGTIAHPLSFRIIVTPGDRDGLYSYVSTVIGSKDAFPIIDVGELQALAAEAGLLVHPGRYVEEAAGCIEALVRASRSAAAARVVAVSQHVDLIERAGVELAQAQALLAPIDLSEIAKPLAAVVEAVAREIDGKRTGALATEFDDAHGGAKAGPQLRVLDLAVQAAALAS